MSDLVSVIVPTYNRAHCLERCLESVLVQTHKEVEILVIDDGSSDNTSELMCARYGNDARVRYLYQRNGGVSSARNYGLREAKGDFIAFLDSDDTWMPWKLKLQIECLRAEPDSGMVWSDMEARDSEGHIFDRHHLRTMYHNYNRFRTEDIFARSRPLREVASQDLIEIVGQARLYTGEIYSQILMGNLVHTSTVLLRRERVERVGGFDENLRPSGEDHDFHLRTCREGPVSFIDLSTIMYQTGLPDQLTHPSFQITIMENYLKSVLPRLEQDRDRITLPPGMVPTVMSRVYADLGRLAWEENQKQRAISWLMESLRYRASQPRTLAWLALVMLPKSMADRALSLFRMLTHASDL